MARPLGTSAQTIRTAPILLIDLETEEGITGHAYLFCYTRMAPGLIAAILTDIEDAARGERLAPVDLSTRFQQRYRLLGAHGIVRMALAGFDVACWDALSLAVGLPLASYIGSQPRPVQAYNSNGLGLMPPEQAADEAEALLEQGFRAVKLRLGRPTAAQDLAVVRAVRGRLPDTIALMADYNQALTVTEAIRRGQQLDGEGLHWIEEPIRHDDYAGCARIAALLRTPVQIGENFAGAQAMAAALSANACDYVMPDLERIGGARRARAIGRPHAARFQTRDCSPVKQMDCVAPLIILSHGLGVFQPQLPFARRRCAGRRRYVIGYQLDATASLDTQKGPHQAHADAKQQKSAERPDNPGRAAAETCQARQEFIELVEEPLNESLARRDFSNPFVRGLGQNSLQRLPLGIVIWVGPGRASRLLLVVLQSRERLGQLDIDCGWRSLRAGNQPDRVGSGSAGFVGCAREHSAQPVIANIARLRVARDGAADPIVLTHAVWVALVIG